MIKEDKEFKTPSIPFPVFNLLQSVIMEKTSEDVLHRMSTEEVFSHVKAKISSSTNKPYRIQKFYPFFWLLSFAQSITTDKLPKLSIAFKSELEDRNLGLYNLESHVINVQIMASEEKIDSETMARVLMHESTHAMTNQIYGTVKPPEGIWGGEMGPAFRVSLLSMFLSPSEGNFMQIHTASNKDMYTLASYPNEFIAEIIAYTIKNGELPLKDSMLPKDREKVELAIEAFLQDCKTYLDKLINESGLPKVMPWLLNCDWLSSQVEIPINELVFFQNFMRTGSLWHAAFFSQDMAIVEKINVVSASYTSSSIFVFPLDIFASLPDSVFKTQVEQLVFPVITQPSAPSFFDSSELSSEPASAPDYSPPINPAWSGDSSFNPDYMAESMHRARFDFQRHTIERSIPTAFPSGLVSKL